MGDGWWSTVDGRGTSDERRATSDDGLEAQVKDGGIRVDDEEISGDGKSWGDAPGMGHSRKKRFQIRQEVESSLRSCGAERCGWRAGCCRIADGGTKESGARAVQCSVQCSAQCAVRWSGGKKVYGRRPGSMMLHYLIGPSVVRPADAPDAQAFVLLLGRMSGVGKVWGGPLSSHVPCCARRARCARCACSSTLPSPLLALAILPGGAPGTLQ